MGFQTTTTDRPTNKHIDLEAVHHGLNIAKEKERTRPETRSIPVADGWAGVEMCVFALSQLDHHDQQTNRRTKPFIESLVRDKKG